MMHILQTKKGSMSDCMELVKSSTSNKVKNHWAIANIGLVQAGLCEAQTLL